jgi:hypothetical protein
MAEPSHDQSPPPFRSNSSLSKMAVFALADADGLQLTVNAPRGLSGVPKQPGTIETANSE